MPGPETRSRGLPRRHHFAAIVGRHHRLELATQAGDILDPDRGDPPPAEARQQVVEVEAVGLVGTGAEAAGLAAPPPRYRRFTWR
jgi:hypothetical protein